MDLLAGRALLRTLHPFMAAEIPQFRLDEALQRGLLPLVVASSKPEEALQAYASLYLEQEVRTEGLTRNVGNFARFLEVISFSHASVLNVSNVARECQIERKTVAGYIEGAALEGLVAQHLRAWLAYSPARAELCYWRTRSGVEVDFVLYGRDNFWATEVKNAARVHPQDLRPLKAFVADYPACTPILLYRGRERLHLQKIWCIPVEEFLEHLRPSHGLLAWRTARLAPTLTPQGHS